MSLASCLKAIRAHHHPGPARADVEDRLRKLEAKAGFPLPEDVKALYRTMDGAGQARKETSSKAAASSGAIDPTWKRLAVDKVDLSATLGRERRARGGVAGSGSRGLLARDLW
jgi:cell wall assembly regulator SMI1